MHNRDDATVREAMAGACPFSSPCISDTCWGTSCSSLGDSCSRPAGTLPFGSVSHGEFRLKNISAPVGIVEVLWRADQQARPPHPSPPEE